MAGARVVNVRNWVSVYDITNKDKKSKVSSETKVQKVSKLKLLSIFKCNVGCYSVVSRDANCLTII